MPGSIQLYRTGFCKRLWSKGDEDKDVLWCNVISISWHLTWKLETPPAATLTTYSLLSLNPFVFCCSTLCYRFLSSHERRATQLRIRLLPKSSCNVCLRHHTSSTGATRPTTPPRVSPPKWRPSSERTGPMKSILHVSESVPDSHEDYFVSKIATRCHNKFSLSTNPNSNHV